MDNNIFEAWQKMGQSAMTAAKELEVINTRVMEQWTGNQMEFANTAMESGSRLMGLMTDVQAYPEMMSGQGKAYSEFNETMLASMRSSSEIVAEARVAYQSWFEKSMQEFAMVPDFNIANVKPAAKARTKKAA